MNFFQSILLGIIQGLTEFFPVSSSGHLVIIEHFFKNFYRPGLMFEILLHLATLVPVFVYYRKELYQVIQGLWHWKSDKFYRGRKLFFMVFLGSIPTGLIGLAFKDIFEQLFSNVWLVLLALTLTGVLLWLASRCLNTGSHLNNSRGCRRGLEEMTVKDALLIGVFQGMAIIPGISRSGATISMGLFCGLDPETSAAYSFMLSIPAILGAVVLEGKDIHLLWQPGANPGAMLTGALVASIFGYLAIKYLVRILSLKRLSPFAWYCWFAAIGTALLLFLMKI